MSTVDTFSENASSVNNVCAVCAGCAGAESGTVRSVETDGVEQANELACTGDTIARRIRLRHKEIVRSLNLVELNPLLWEMDVVDPQEDVELSDVTPKKRAERLLNFLERKGVDVYVKFLECVRKETSHMGHQYITSLLEGEDEDEDRLDSFTKLRKEIKKHSTALMKITLPDLLPLLWRDKLLTEDENDQLTNSHKTSKEKIQHLLDVLYTKGPQAHSIFLSCLAEDKTNPYHNELYEAITSCGHYPPRKRKWKSDCIQLDCVKRTRRDPHRIEMKGVLKSRRYFEEMQVWRKWLSNGQWRELDGKAEEYMGKSCTDEMTLAVVLECAMGWIFRKDKQKALNLIEQCQNICQKKIHQENPNYYFLLGRCEYTMSWVFKYFHEFEQSRKYADKAMATLALVEPGEDRALANYGYASIIVECLAHSDSPSTDEVMKAKCAFRYAIDTATLYDCGLSHIADHAHIRLAHMYLGATHNEAGESENTEDAWCSLRAVDVDKYPSTSRTRCLYYLAESVIHKVSGNVPDAITSASYTLEIAKRNNFQSEVASAENKLRDLGVSC